VPGAGVVEGATVDVLGDRGRGDGTPAMVAGGAGDGIGPEVGTAIGAEAGGEC